MRTLSCITLFVLVAATAAVSRAECPGVSVQDEQARALYEEALAAEVKGNLGQARELLERLLSQYPDGMFACWARPKLEDLRSGKGRLNREGRAQFITGATLYGAWSGFSIAMIATGEDMDDAESKAAIWSAIGGSVAGLVPSILLSSDLPMSTGRATMINFGWSWGLWHGMAFSFMPAPDLSVRTTFGLSLGLSALGWGGTFALTRYLDVADGDAALVSTTGPWFTWFTAAIGTLIAEEEFFDDEKVWIPILLAGGDAGVAGAALLTGKFDMSAGRVNLINLGGLMGGLVGSGILALAEPDNIRAAVGLELGMTLVGLAAGAFFTRNYDAPATPASGLSLLELTPEGWAVAAPVPRFRPGPRRADGTRALGLELGLVGGRF
jgi:hypothetical protein